MRKYKGRYYDLHVHTMGSLLDGAIKTKDLVSKYTDGGGIADHGQAYELINFYKAMKKVGKKPILGVEVYTENLFNRIYPEKNNDLLDKKAKLNHLVLIAKSNLGLKNLFKLVTESNNFKIDGRPVVTLEHIQEYGEDLLVLSGCLGGELSSYLKNKEYDKAKELASFFKSIYKDDYYLEIQRHDVEEERIVNPLLVKLSQELDIKLVATSDAHYLNKEDDKIHEIVLCIGTKKTIDDPKRFKFEGKNYHLPTITEMEERFFDLPQALDSTVEIFEKCNVEIYFPKGNIEEYHIPKVNLPKNYTGDEFQYFRELCEEGFEYRFKNQPEKLNNLEYINRLHYEIQTIKDMKYVSYFLNLKEILMIAEELGIYIGPGRGSAAGSLVAYCLRITDLDPLEFGLLFERFLNKERVSMPDVDTDIEDSRRDELINKIKEVRGKEYVSQIATFGTMGAKESIRSIVRVLGYGYQFGDKLSKMIPSTPGISIEESLKLSPELKYEYDNDERTRDVIDKAKKIEGLKRNLSTHAAAVVIADKPISEYLPLTKVDGNWITQDYMNTVEEIGLLKMDFLGLKTLTVIRQTIEAINNESMREVIKYREIPIYDINVYKNIIATGNTDSVFQLESKGMKAFIKDLYKDIENLDINKLNKQEQYEKGKECFERLIAGISLYRPGPMESIPKYIENMRNPNDIEYLHESLEPILKNTYGVIIYQEQVMQIVQELAGYTLGSADIIRRAMGKKDMNEMEKNRKIFIYGEKRCTYCNGDIMCSNCNGEGKVLKKYGETDDKNTIIQGALAKGISIDICNKIYDSMIDFAKYAFNKSHAASYAVLAAKTAYLKYYYPIDYMVANLNCVIKDSKKIKHYLQACKRMKLTILPPDINSSDRYFKKENKEYIRFGLEGIKNLGKISILIEQERIESGFFTSYQNFVERMSKCDGIDKTVLESTILSGALDSMEGSRKAKLSVVNQMLQHSKNIKNESDSNQISLFNCSMFEGLSSELNSLRNIDIPLIEEFDKNTKLELEKDYSGIYISEHPLEQFYDVLDTINHTAIKDLLEEDSDNNRIKNKSNCCVVGIIKDIEIKYSKNGKKFMLANIEDLTGEISLIGFEKFLNEYIMFIQNNSVIILEGSFEEDDFGNKIIVNKIMPIQNISQTPVTNTFRYIIIKAKTFNKSIIYELNDIIYKYPGNQELIIIFENGKKMRCKNKVDIDNPFLREYIDKKFKGEYKFI